MDGAVETSFQVQGMTCSHCVNAVTSEMLLLPGVSQVDIDLDSGTVSVTSDKSLDVEVVREAIDEAGYELIT
ncbi:MAG: cation transporter [Actinomycetes bacterium]